MRDRKAHGHGVGIVLQENQNPLVDLRFADDILIFAASSEQSLDMLRSLVDALRNVGLLLHVLRTKLLTTQAQPPDHVWLDMHTKIDVVRTSHIWLGCQSSYVSNISRPLSHRFPVWGKASEDLPTSGSQIRCGMATIAAYFVGSPARTGLEHAVASDFAQLEPTRP